MVTNDYGVGVAIANNNICPSLSNITRFATPPIKSDQHENCQIRLFESACHSSLVYPIPILIHSIFRMPDPDESMKPIYGVKIDIG